MNSVLSEMLRELRGIRTELRELRAELRELRKMSLNFRFPTEAEEHELRELLREPLNEL